MFAIQRVRAMSGPRRVLLVALAIAVVPLVLAAVVVRVLFTHEDQGASQSTTIARQGRDIHGLQATNGRQADDIHRLTLAVDAFRALVLATTPEQRQAALSQLQAAGAPAAPQPAPSSAPAASPPTTTTTGPAHEPRPADGGSAGTANTAGPQPSASPQPSPSTSPSPPIPPPSSPPPAPPPRPPPCRLSLPVVGTCVLR